MKHGATLFFLLLAAAPGVRAQSPAGAPALDDAALLGMRLFNQSCRVCHVKPQAASPQYAPPLSKDTLGGDAAATRGLISGGSPRMPGFKNHFRPAEIDAIVAYLKTIEPPAPPPAAPAASPTPPAAPAESAPPKPAGTGASREAD